MKPIEDSLRKAFYQAKTIRKGNTRTRNTTLSPMAIKLWDDSLRKKFQEDCPDIKVSLSLFIETILWHCKKIFIEK